MIDNRLPGSDFMRAAACVMVLCSHLAQRMSYPLAPIDGFGVFRSIGPLGVGVFFVLSGFLLARPFWVALDAGAPMPSLRTFALRRAARVLPGFWLALTATAILSATLFGVPADGWHVLRYVTGMAGLSGWHWVTLFPVDFNTPLWSVGLELIAYAILPLGFVALFAVRQATGSARGARILWAGVIASAVLAHMVYVAAYPQGALAEGPDFASAFQAKLWTPRFNPFGFFAIFAVGSLAAGVQVKLARMRSGIFDLIALGALLGSLVVLALHMLAPEHVGYGFAGIPEQFPALPACIALFLAAAPSSLIIGPVLDNPLTRFVARISFGIYVWHALVIHIVRATLVPDFDFGRMTDAQGFVVTSAVIVAISVVVATASYYWLESPLVRWARQLETAPRHGRSAGRISSARLSPD